MSDSYRDQILHQRQPGVRTWDGEPDSPSAVNSSSIAAIQCVAELMLKAQSLGRKAPANVVTPTASVNRAFRPTHTIEERFNQII
jgi:hypothetical protein